MGRVPLEFPKYNINQVSEILSSRCQDAFNTRTIGSDIIDEVSKMTISPTVNGDVRYSLDLLLYAGNLAESQGTERITLDQIRKVNSQINPSITSEEIEETVIKPDIHTYGSGLEHCGSRKNSTWISEKSELMQ